MRSDERERRRFLNVRFGVIGDRIAMAARLPLYPRERTFRRGHQVTIGPEAGIRCLPETALRTMSDFGQRAWTGGRLIIYSKS
jgi:hypothetical protein